MAMIITMVMVKMAMMITMVMMMMPTMPSLYCVLYCHRHRCRECCYDGEFCYISIVHEAGGNEDAELEEAEAGGNEEAELEAEAELEEAEAV